MDIFWTLDADSLFATASVGPGFPIWCLIAEPMPDHASWDWAVWLPGRSPSLASHGAARSAFMAMARAETSARELIADTRLFEPADGVEK